MKNEKARMKDSLFCVFTIQKWPGVNVRLIEKKTEVMSLLLMKKK